VTTDPGAPPRTLLVDAGRAVELDPSPSRAGSLAA
jgi:hypothetical protein